MLCEYRELSGVLFAYRTFWAREASDAGEWNSQGVNEEINYIKRYILERFHRAMGLAICRSDPSHGPRLFAVPMNQPYPQSEPDKNK